MPDLIGHLMEMSIGKLAILSLLLVMLLIGLNYLYIVVESYARIDGLREVFRYGKYDVEIERDGEVKEVISVKAWNKTNAVERVAKRIGGTELDGLVFRVNKDGA